MNPINPLVLVFDLDETVFSVEKEKGDKNPLSISAQKSLSDSSCGIVENPPLLNVKSGEKDIQVLHAHKVTALNRHALNTLLQNIFIVIQKSKILQIDCPISVKIMTSANYTEEHVKKIFDTFFGNGTSRFTNGDFPIEYYNVFDLNNDLPASRVGSKTQSGDIDLRKAELLNDKFPQWKEVMVGLTKERVCLIDNADYNTVAVELKGFKAFHYPSTPSDRNSNENFTSCGPETISKLLGLVSEIDSFFSSSLIGFNQG